MTAVNAVLAVLFAAPMVWLLVNHRFFNPEFIDRLDWGTTNPLGWLTRTVVVVVVLTAIWDVVEVAVRAERARRGLPTQIPGTGGYTAQTG